MSNQNHSLHPRFGNRTLWICMTVLAWLLLSATGARADATYCYQGNTYTFAVDLPQIAASLVV